MADITDITERVGTGGAIQNEQDVQELIRRGYTGVIDCRGEMDDTALLATHPEIAYLYAGVPDDGQPKPVSWFESGINFALPLLSKPHQKIFAHCAAGQNRGPSMALAVLMAQGLEPSMAENLMRQKRPQVTLAYKLDAAKAVRELGYIDQTTGSAFGDIVR